MMQTNNNRIPEMRVESQIYHNGLGLDTINTVLYYLVHKTVEKIGISNSAT